MPPLAPTLRSAQSSLGELDHYRESDRVAGEIWISCAAAPGSTLVGVFRQ